MTEDEEETSKVRAEIRSVEDRSTRGKFAVEEKR